MKFFITITKCFLLSSIFCYSQNESIEDAFNYYNDQKYELALHVFESFSEDEECHYYSAECSKKINSAIAKYKFYRHLDLFPNSFFRDNCHLSLAQIYYQEKDYRKAINHFLEINAQLAEEDMLNLAYSYFQLNFLDESNYLFSKLIDNKSHYSAVAQYYYAHTAYKQKHYKRALNSFNKLRYDEDFSSIVPYYIAQIYFFQKRYRDLISYSKLILENIIPSRKSELHRLIAESNYKLGEFTNSIYHFEIYLSEIGDSETIDYLQIGHAYYSAGDYLSAIKYLEKASAADEKSLQVIAYYLGATYLELEYKNYALNSFKKASQYSSNPTIQEDAMYNYIKLSYELDLPFNNTIETIQSYLIKYQDSKNIGYLQTLMTRMLGQESEYNKALLNLKKKPSLSLQDKKQYQRLAYFLGVKSFNNMNYEEAISFFNESCKYSYDSHLEFLCKFWIADSYYQLKDYTKSLYSYENISDITSSKISFYLNLKKYNQAYCYFNLEKYEEANKLFRNYIKNSNDSLRINDSYLRIADGFFIDNQFILASKYYKKSIEYNLFDVDYALFNQGICYNLLENDRGYVETLKMILDNYPSSIYHDDALLNLANHYSENNLLLDAFTCYDQLISSTPKNHLIAAAYLNKGMIYLRNSEVNKAIDMFMIIIDKYKDSRYFKEALSSLEAAYTSMGDIESYLNVISQIPQVNISLLQKDSLTFKAAYLKYIELDNENAKKGFNQYINNFKEGIFLESVRYYNAQNFLRMKDTLNAVMQYKEIVKSGKALFLEKSIIFLSRYYYKAANYPNANMYYSALEKIASSNDLKREAILHLMHINDSNNESSTAALDYAYKVIDFEKIDDSQLARALIIIARSDIREGNYFRARTLFKKIVNISYDDIGSEAFYMLIYLSYLEGEHDLVEDMVFDMVKKYNNHFYLAEAFILLSDIYRQKGKFLQAKVTLENIIETYDNEEVKNKARLKWESIIASQKKDQNISNVDESYLDIDEENIEYELIINE